MINDSNVVVLNSVSDFQTKYVICRQSDKTHATLREITSMPYYRACVCVEGGGCR